MANDCFLSWAIKGVGDHLEIILMFLVSAIKSATIGSPTASAIADGTSMAAPHVTGALAHYLDTQCEAPSPEVVKGWLQHHATTSAVTLNDIGITPNKLLYMPCYWGENFFLDHWWDLFIHFCWHRRLLNMQS